MKILYYIIFALALYLSKDNNMYLSSYLIAKITSNILPILCPLHKGWDENEIKNLRKLLEPKKIEEAINIRLDKNDHRHSQEIYLNEEDRILYRLYVPNNRTSNVIIWFHGGGFVIGNVRSEDNVCRRLSEETNSVVVNVNYGLSPENKFPVAIEDALNSVKWVYKNIHKFNSTNKNIYLAGESAGGNLVISIIPELKIKIKGIISIYPPLQMYSYNTSHWKYANYNGLLTLNHLSRVYDRYLSEIMDSQNYKASPILMNDNMIKTFPKVLFILAEYDILHDDGITFANKLKKNKIETIVKSYPDIHGFFNRFGYGEEAFNEVKKFII